MTDLKAARQLAQDAASGRLILKDLTKRFGSGAGQVTAVDSINLDIAPGEFVTLLGPSGCGKTTTLRMIAGFEDPTSGSVLLDDADMITLPPNKRPMAMVFQSYALFPHLRVRENVEYGLKLKKVPSDKLKEAVELALESMNLEALADRAPNQLSGGQQQRVALARALVMRPKVLLFDEPLSNLDAKLRERMRLEIRNLQHEMGITSVYVTHDQAEAMSMSDRIVVMNQGRIEQAAPPAEIYRNPESKFVADFIGRANFIPVTLDAERTDGHARTQVFGRDVSIPTHPNAGKGNATLVIRPESMQLRRSQPAGDTLQGSEGRVISSVFYGDHMEYEVQTAHGLLTAVVSDPVPSQFHNEGDHVSIDFNVERAWIVPADE